ncbi:MAG: carboxypeptidase regulatory-like domain-containing protein [Candidatus Cloacimonetes bacterium]|nr:carboxypeptidase regulatory-like domain-containing protein [Candidatus Cloacimonadota bacterium]
MKKLCLLLAAFSFVFLCFADIEEFYSFNSTIGTYTPITGTPISDIQTDDAISAAIPIGFSFPYGEDDFESVMVSSNGWVGLGTTFTHSTLSNILESVEWLPVLAPLWDDTSLFAGTASTLLSGTAPNRIFTIQYQGLRWNYSADNSLDFQVLLYENGKIEFCYGPSSGANNYPSASIGINMAPGGSESFISITPGTPAIYSITLANNSIVEYPGNGVIYQFIPVTPQGDDLSATSISGNRTPSVNSPTVYNINIRNRGVNPQSTYVVQLIDADDTVLGSADGVALNPGETHSFAITWTPDTEGPMQLRGKVILATDQNPQNDYTSYYQITVMPEGMAVITIGEGNQEDRVPVDMFWRNSLYETIYYPTEINMFGTISAIALYNNFQTNLPDKPIKIWLGSTANQDLSEGWVPAGDLTLVFDGTVTFPSGANTIMIPLSTPYVYTGGNLVMMVNRPMDTQYYNSMDMFKVQSNTQQRALRVQSDSTEYLPDAPPAGTATSTIFPKTSLYMTPLSPDPIVMVNPSPLNFPQVLMNQSVNRTISIMNGGGGVAAISSISLSGNPFFTITNLPDLPQNLSTGQNIPLTIQYAPTAAGEHSAVLTVVDNTTRLTHTVDITGNCMDPYIYTLPYSQNFDAVSIPNIPLDWQKHVTSTTTYAYVQTNDAGYSNPNCVGMYNAEDMSSQLFLICPPLDNSISISSSRVCFYAKSNNQTSQLSVGVMSDPADPTTYVETQIVQLTLQYSEQIVSFAAYTGTGRFIAFKHANINSYETIRIDDVMLEQTPDNDLAALQITGNTTPSVNSLSQYMLRVVNRGTVTQSAYQVKLYAVDGDIELASANGLTVAADEVVQVPISWTPTTEGPMQIYAKVLLAGDQNSLNDQTPPLQISVFPEGIMAVTIGTGDLLGRLPMDFFYKNSLNQTIYYTDEMSAFGNITSITLYSDFLNNLPNKEMKIWLATTTEDDLSGGWRPYDDFTLVYDGLVNFPSGQSSIVIPLQTVFTYAGGNLVMMVKRPMDTIYFSSSDRFRCQTGTQLRTLNVYADVTDYDPANPPAGVDPQMNYHMVTFHMTPLSDEPLFYVAPIAWDFGTTLLNNTYDKQIRIMNVGGGSLGINSIAISGSPFFSLQNLPVLPLSLNTGQTAQFTVRYNPTAVGEHEATITIVDNQTGTRSISLRSTRESHTVSFSATCVDPTIVALPYLQNFDSVTAPNLPVQWTTIIQSADSGSYIKSMVDDSYSAPNHVVMYNGSDIASQLLLIGPPYANTIPTNTTRTRFRAKSDYTGATLEVGILSNPQDPATFTLIQALPLTTTWDEYIVTFGAYTGTGRVVAFRHGNAQTYMSVRIDDITFELNPENDLAVISLQGNITPTMGMSTNYTVNVFNWGNQPQSNYQIKLYRQDGIELSTIDGATITPGQLLPQTIPWIPNAEGPTAIYAKVIMTTDQDPLNDQSPNLSINVQPPGQVVLTIGEPLETARIPMDMYYCNSLYECIYYPAELSNTLGMINGIAFYNQFNTDLPNMPINIWMGTTTQADLSTGYIPSTQLTPVFEGTADFPSGENMIHISFPEPYLYLDGQNLVVMVERPMDTSYYSYSDMFKGQDDQSARARNDYSDMDDFDPANPPDGSSTGFFPQTSIFITPGGVGHIEGAVIGVDSQPLEGVQVTFNPGAYNTITDANGEYSIINIIADDYAITFSKYGYITQGQNVQIQEDETLVLNISLQPMPTVVVTGTIQASDTGAALAGALIHLEGYQDYNANSTATGSFSIPAVYANQSYEYTIMCPGYTSISGTIDVGSTACNMGVITMNEIAYAPHNVIAELNSTFDAINLSWEAPDPTAIEIVESFEGDSFPPLLWTQQITNTGPINSTGVYPTWCRFGTITISGEIVSPTEGNYQSGLWWSYDHQDEWLITPSFNCPSEAYLSFDGYVFLGSTNNDHYYVKASTDNGNTWSVLWDASIQTGDWNYYDSPITVDLSAFTGLEVILAFNAVDPPSNDGLWYTWFIDNIYIGNAISGIVFNKTQLYAPRSSVARTLSSSTPDLLSRSIANGLLRQEGSLPSKFTGRCATPNHRALVGYQVYRLTTGQENNEASWIDVNTDIITNLELTDDSWETLPNGTYRWAVKAVYTAGVSSGASFSNSVVREQLYGTVVGFIRRQNNQGIAGATVSSGDYSATTNNAGAYSLYLPAGMHDITASATGFTSQTVEAINVLPNQNITLNFIMLPVSNQDEQIEVVATSLNGNIPNPFNPSTTIMYDILEPCPVTLEIFNTKGQKVRTLIDDWKNRGHHKAIFDARDDRGHSMASGIYFYRLTAGNYIRTRKMLLME